MKPLFMYAGGKSKMLKHYEPYIPRHFTTYVEPFAGGAAMFAYMTPTNSILNDVNTEIMKLYWYIKHTSPSEVEQDLTPWVVEYLNTPLEARKEMYYQLRKEYWSTPTPDKLFLLLKTGFNGVWQTCKESNGLYGTPAGLLKHTNKDQLIPRGILNWHRALQNTQLLCRSYSDINVPPDSFIFLDPPYRGSFTSYGVEFTDADHRELAQWALEQRDKGNTVLLSNRDLGDNFYGDMFSSKDIHLFPVTYTAGRRKKVPGGYEAKQATEMLVTLTP